MIGKAPKLATAAIGALAISAGAALSDSHVVTKFRIQTYFSPETLSGQMAATFMEDVHTMSNGEIAIEIFPASSVVKSAKTFDAAASGSLDCDMTGSSYQTGKTTAFQIAGDLNDGYANPCQPYVWLLYDHGYQALNDLCNPFKWHLSAGGSWGRNRSPPSIRPVARIISRTGSSGPLWASSTGRMLLT